MSAEILRRAAALMRERAEVATSAPWSTAGVDGMGFAVHRGEHDTISLYSQRQDAEHMASWHPAVALAVAKAMDDVAHAWEISDGWVRDLDDDAIRFEDTVDGGWLTVARAYLGETS